MTISHTITISWDGGGTPISKASTISFGSEINLDESIADSSTDLLVAFTLDVSALKSFFMVSDQAITVETNNGTTPDDTFTLAANVPIVWDVNSGAANPFASAVDVTALYVTNSSGSAATLQIRCGYDPTP